MKKIFSGLLIGMIVISTSVSNLKAQMSVANVSYSKTQIVPAVASAAEDKTPSDEMTANNKDNVNKAKADLKTIKANLKSLKANWKATEGLRKEFKDVSDAKWYSDKNAMSAFFEKNGVATRVTFNKRGGLIHSISFYGENVIPADIKSLLTTTYTDYKIIGLDEVKEGNTTFYLAYLENDTSYKQICIYNGECGLYKELTKQL